MPIIREYCAFPDEKWWWFGQGVGDEREGTERGQIWKVFIVEPKGLIDGLALIEQKVKDDFKAFCFNICVDNNICDN